MYSVTVPVMADTLCRSDFDRMVEELKRLDCERVMIAIEPFKTQEKRDEELREIKKYCKLFKEQGYEVGAWLWTFWYEGQEKFTHMCSITGNEDKFECCPSDENYRRYMADELKAVVKCGVDLILFDDDFRYGFLADGEICCLCENHLKKFSADVRENVTHEFLEEKLLSGGPNPYRDAWICANGYYMELFAKEMRDAVDSVNPKVRLGRCACMTAWDIDGTDPIKIGRLLAGKTKPFLRLIGAPYWAVNKSWGNRIQDVIEVERLEKSWTIDDNFEIIAEGDCYPRPRYNCPAAYVEGFDTALRADGSLNGILKYGIDYYSSVEYETGYAANHEKNKGLYNLIENKFAYKPAVGVRVYEFMKLYKNMQIPKNLADKYNVQYMIFSPASKMLSAAAVPTVYDGTGVCGIAFGENARYLKSNDFDKGLIIDLSAAKIFAEMGIDVGIKYFGNEAIVTGEYHIEENEYVNLVSKYQVNRLELKQMAKVDSEFLVEGEANIPASYFYENKKGQRFFVLCFAAHFTDEYILRSYMRGVQVAKAAQWFGEELPSRFQKNPDLYMMCKQQKGELCVGLWNFSVDAVLKPEIILSKEYKEIEFINCTGELSGNKVTLCKLAPFDFARICVR